MNSLPGFHPFDRHKPLRIYYRDLPHWRQDGATYFVTFRQADSIPHSVVRRWQDERIAWYAAHGLNPGCGREECARAYAAISEHERRAFERREARQLFLEVDRCHGSCLLRVPANRKLISDALRYFDGSRCRVGDFVVLPNHVHALLLPLPGYPLERILQSVKRWTSTRMANRLTGSTKFWQADSYDHIVRDREELRRIRQYITTNPEKAGVGNAFAHYSADWLDEAN